MFGNLCAGIVELTGDDRRVDASEDLGAAGFELAGALSQGGGNARLNVDGWCCGYRCRWWPRVASGERKQPKQKRQGEP